MATKINNLQHDDDAVTAHFQPTNENQNTTTHETHITVHLFPFTMDKQFLLQGM